MHFIQFFYNFCLNFTLPVQILNRNTNQCAIAIVFSRTTQQVRLCNAKIKCTYNNNKIESINCVRWLKRLIENWSKSLEAYLSCFRKVCSSLLYQVLLEFQFNSVLMNPITNSFIQLSKKSINFINKLCKKFFTFSDSCLSHLLRLSKISDEMIKVPQEHHSVMIKLKHGCVKRSWQFIQIFDWID